MGGARTPRLQPWRPHDAPDHRRLQAVVRRPAYCGATRVTAADSAEPCQKVEVPTPGVSRFRCRAGPPVNLIFSVWRPGPEPQSLVRRRGAEAVDVSQQHVSAACPETHQLSSSRPATCVGPNQACDLLSLRGAATSRLRAEGSIRLPFASITPRFKRRSCSPVFSNHTSNTGTSPEGAGRADSPTRSPSTAGPHATSRVACP